MKCHHYDNQHSSCEKLFGVCGNDDGNDEGDDYGGECMYLDYYVEAWKKLIAKIMSGEVDENNLNKWLAYFVNREEWEFGIDFFVKYN